MVAPAFFGPLDTFLAPVAEHFVLALVLLNLVTRSIAHRSYVKQASEGIETLGRHLGHELSNLVLVLGSFYYLTLHQHSGIVLTLLVLGMFVADLFEFEARKVEARNDLPIEAPKGAIAGSVLVLAYAAFLSLFFVIAPVWNAIV